MLKGKAMDNERKKQPIQAWKNRKPEMGVFSLTCTATGDAFLGATLDAKRAFNGIRARLENDMHPNKALQALWNEHGEDSIVYEVVALLDYDDPGEDHAEDLQALLDLCLDENPEAQRL